MGTAHHAIDIRIEHNISRSYIPHEWPRDGNQGHPVVPKCPSGRCPFRCLRKEIVPARDRVLHLLANSVDDHQHFLVSIIYLFRLLFLN